MRREEDFLCYDFQGWPEYKMNLEEILDCLHVEKNDDGDYVIKKDSPILKGYIKILQDDGMGYGVDEQFIVEASCMKVNGEMVINMFAEKKDNESTDLQ